MPKKTIEFENTERVEFLDYVKKKRRWAFFWGFLVATIIGCIVFAAKTAETSYPFFGPQIAHVAIEGTIFQDDYRSDMLREIKNRADVQAVILEINSPGGGIFASEELYHHIRDIAAEKPVVALMRDVAASGGYITAIGADHIIAGQTTVTGSIGVITSIPDFSEALDRLGIDETLIRSSESKGGISPFREPTAEEIADQEQLIENMYQWFKSTVGERRGLQGNNLDAVSKGTVFTGQQALENGLIDEIGGYDAALAYLLSENEKLEDLEVEEWKPLYPVDELGNYVTSLSGKAQAHIRDSILNANAPSFMAILH